MTLAVTGNLPDHAKPLIQALFPVIRRTLWGPHLDRVQRHYPSATLGLRVGSGEATHCRLSRENQHFTLTIGVENVRQKLQPLKAPRWLTYKEIQSRGYFGRRTGVANMLVHTALHEFAHVLQIAGGQRKRGSVHNDDFYRILDGFYSSGIAERLLLDFKSACASHSIPLTDMEQQWEQLATQKPPNLIDDWQKGQRVNVINGKGVLVFTGVIERLNKYTITVRSGARWYRSPPSLLSLA